MSARHRRPTLAAERDAASPEHGEVDRGQRPIVLAATRRLQRRRGLSRSTLRRGLLLAARVGARVKNHERVRRSRRRAQSDAGSAPQHEPREGPDATGPSAHGRPIRAGDVDRRTRSARSRYRNARSDPPSSPSWTPLCGLRRAADAADRSAAVLGTAGARVPKREVCFTPARTRTTPIGQCLLARAWRSAGDRRDRRRAARRRHGGRGGRFGLSCTVYMGAETCAASSSTSIG